MKIREFLAPKDQGNQVDEKEDKMLKSNATDLKTKEIAMTVVHAKQTKWLQLLFNIF